MSTCRELRNDYMAAISELNGNRPGRPPFELRSTYINALDREEADLARMYPHAEFERRRRAARDCAALVRNLNIFHVQIADLNLLNQADPQYNLRVDLQTLCQQAMQPMVTLVEALLADGRYNEKQIELMDRLVVALQAVNRNPLNVNNLATLALEKNKLNSMLEIGNFSHQINSAGRLVLGILEAILGVAVILAGLSSGLGFLLTVGIALYTACTADKVHWGPLTWGNQLFWSGIGLAKSGPTFFQREAAISVNDQLNLIKAKAEEMQLPVAQPLQPLAPQI